MIKILLLTLCAILTNANARNSKIPLPKEFTNARRVLSEAHEANVDQILPKTMARAENYYEEGLLKFRMSFENDSAEASIARDLANQARALAEDAMTLAEDVRSWDVDMQDYLEIKSLMDMELQLGAGSSKTVPNLVVR